MSRVVVFKYLVLHWKAGTSHMLLERETAVQESGGNSKSSFGPQLSIPTPETEVYLQHTCFRPTVFCDFGLVYEMIYFSWSWENVETES